MARKAILLTTSDNVYDVDKEFDKWYMEDIRLGHKTCERIADLYPSDAPEYNPELMINLMESIYDKIIEDDPLKLYVKVEVTEDY